ncbi:hypothetical protein [Halopenitus sp. POP-27]|uniref:hypothetical protein n=1 Tax=Halopenitus sp. POP-27 TaxID=2994425 RepID=UPI002469B5D6|nr:hypothetical protein [Halopenitus sp. POP-27]
MHDPVWTDGGARTETDREAEAEAVVEAFLDRDLVDGDTRSELRRLLAADRPVEALRIATRQRRKGR